MGHIPCNAKQLYWYVVGVNLTNQNATSRVWEERRAPCFEWVLLGALTPGLNPQSGNLVALLFLTYSLTPNHSIVLGGLKHYLSIFTAQSQFDAKFHLHQNDNTKITLENLRGVPDGAAVLAESPAKNGLRRK